MTRRGVIEQVAIRLDALAEFFENAVCVRHHIELFEPGS